MFLNAINKLLGYDLIRKPFPNPLGGSYAFVSGFGLMFVNIKHFSFQIVEVTLKPVANDICRAPA